jgi:hypothetical protein
VQSLMPCKMQRVLRNTSVFVALGIQHVKRVRRVILSSVSCLAPHYLINGTIIGVGGELVDMKCVF